MTTHAAAPILLIALALTSACATVSYPNNWHDANGAVTVFGAVPTTTVPIPANSDGLTLYQLIFDLKPTNGDLTDVTLIRRSGAETLRLSVDMRKMVLTGDTTQNYLLRAGDVVHIPG